MNHSRPASNDDARPSADTATAPRTLTYPISPDYVKTWTSERALAELIANALDEDRAARVQWEDGTLVIEDSGNGIPMEGLVLGYSPKDTTDIGQFGEGAKIATLVLARAPEVTRVHVDTVAYAFTPSLERHAVLSGLAPTRLEQPPHVLVYTFDETTRTHGTRVEVDCPREIADAAISRFRHLTEPDYVAPTGHAEILLDGRTGRLFVGGVLVSQQQGLHASYDFPLAVAKSAQNRDRTVIDAQVVTGLVRDALASSTRADVARHFTELALAGRRFRDPEKYFDQVSDPMVRAAFRAVSAELFAGQKVFFSDAGDEAAVDLLDGAHQLVTTNLERGLHWRLMDLLDVPRAQVARAQDSVTAAKKTTYIDVGRLTKAEQQVLTDAIGAVRAVFGATALGRVRVYTHSESGYLSCADGFYAPNNGMVAISRAVLDRPQRALEVLLHEAGHRRAHRRGAEHGDRTRGFESELTQMLAAAVTGLVQSGPADVAPAADDEPQVPLVRAELAALLHELLPTTLARLGVTDEGKLSDRLGLHRNYLRLLLEPRPAGWRRPASSMSPSVVVKFRMHEVFATAFDVHPGVTWLAHMLPDGPTYGATRDTAGGPWSSRMRNAAAPALEALDHTGGPYAAAAAQARALLSGDSATGPDVDEWTGFAHRLVQLERQRLRETGAGAPEDGRVQS